MSNGNNSEKYLTAVDSLSANDYVRCLKSGSSRKITLSDLIASINANGSNVLSVVTTTNNYLATAANDVVFADVSIAPLIVTLPDATTAQGKVISVKKKDGSTNDVTVQDAAGNNIDGSVTITLSGSGGARPGVELISDGSNWYILNA